MHKTGWNAGGSSLHRIVCKVWTVRNRPVNRTPRKRETRDLRIEAPSSKRVQREGGSSSQDEFMEPLGISSYKLAQSINVPVSRIQDILHGRRKITIDTSIRLAKFFGISDRYFWDIQNDIDIRNLKVELATKISKIPLCQSSY